MAELSIIGDPAALLAGLLSHALVGFQIYTADEAEIMAGHRWWSPRDLARTSETVWPADLPAMLHPATSRLFG